MKISRTLFLTVVVGILASCQMHRGNFSKRKYLDLKKMNNKEEVVVAAESEIKKIEEQTYAEPIEEIVESSSSVSNEESENNLVDDISETDNQVEEINNDIEITNSDSEISTESETSFDETPTDETVVKDPKVLFDLFFWPALITRILGIVFVILAYTAGGPLYTASLILLFGFILASYFCAIVALIQSQKIPKEQRDMSFRTKVGMSAFFLVSGLLYLLLGGLLVVFG